MQLSKSDYMLFLKHPAWLWLKKHDKTKLPPIDHNTQAMFDAGNMFESYAEQLFTEGITLGFSSYQEYLSLPLRTNEALEKGAKVIFQGRFECGDITCISDVISVVNDKTIDLYEIKSSTRVKLDHLYDLAFQMVVLERCGYTVNNIYVIHVNNEYVRQGEIDCKGITAVSDVTNQVKDKKEETESLIEKALDTMRKSTIPDISPSLSRSDSFREWMAIYRNLVTLDPESIYDLCRVTGEDIGKLEALQIKRLVDIHDSYPLSDKQRLQVKAIKDGKETINIEKIREFLNTLMYPLYFLDYETLAGAIPFFDGLRPYQQLPFQYSLHRLNHPGGVLEHFTYLHSDNSNPSAALSKSLKTHLGPVGSVLVWNESFEKNCNTLLGTMVPEYASFFQDVNSRIVDLMTPFSSDWYIHKDFGGSASIKKVLPVLVTELSYKELGIQEGEAAQRLWMDAVLHGTRDSEKEAILRDLHEYCKLDTLAMVEIYKQLQGNDLQNGQLRLID